ncbi:hypothetical protein PTKIN_Ptkin09bG0193100 [Pterospermum kingtungense]
MTTVITGNFRPKLIPSQLKRNSAHCFLRPFKTPVFRRSLTAKVRAFSAASVETKPTHPAVVEKDNSGGGNGLACPICYEPLTRISDSPSYEGSTAGSYLKCNTCKKTYFGNRTHLDLVASSGSKQYDEPMPLATELFRSVPILCFYGFESKDLNLNVKLNGRNMYRSQKIEHKSFTSFRLIKISCIIQYNCAADHFQCRYYQLIRTYAWCYNVLGLFWFYILLVYCMLVVSLTRTPVVSFLYERGWRQLAIFGGFPGPEKEFDMAKNYLKPVLGGNIVDASCGSGLFSRRFAKSGLFSQVVALDYSENMLRQCYEFIEEENFPKEKVTLVRADISRLPFKSGSVDAVHAGLALHCWPSPSTAVAEISRVLRPGGVFVATTYILDGPFAFVPFLRTFRQNIIGITGWHLFLSERELEDLCHTCGLVGFTYIRNELFVMISARKGSYPSSTIQSC